MDRTIIFAPIAFGVGIGVYFQIPMEPGFAVSVPLFAFSVGIVGFLLLAQEGRDRARFLAILTLFVLLGFLAAQYRSYSVSAPILAESDAGRHHFEGRIVEVEHFDDGDRLTIDTVSLKAVPETNTPERIRLRLRSSGQYRIGQFIHGAAVLHPPPQASVPGVYDFARRAWFMRIGAVGFALGDPTRSRRMVDVGALNAVGVSIDRFRDMLGETIYQALGEGEAAGVAIALAIGDRTRIPQETKDELRVAGLAHLLAISGLHMMLVVVFLFSCFRALCAAFAPLALRYPIKKWAAAIAIVGAFLYLLLAGMTIPTQRAFLMALVAMMAIIIDRTPISLRLVAFSALVILAFRPESLLSASFQLSFAAVTALVSVYETTWLQRLNALSRKTLLFRFGLYFLFLSLTTVVASAATTPLAWHHFGHVAPYGLLGNLLAIPVMAFVVMPLLILTIVASVFLPLSSLSIIAWPLHEGLSLVLAIAKFVSGLEGAEFHLVPLHEWSLYLVLLGGFVLCLGRGRNRIAGVAGIVLGLIIAPLFPVPDILVAGNGRLIAVRVEPSKVFFSTLERESYNAGLWVERFGEIEKHSFPGAKENWQFGDFRCDELACLLADKKGKIVSIVEEELALLDDCTKADILLAPTMEIPKRFCQKPSIVIDRKALKHNGGYAVYLYGRYPWGGTPAVAHIRKEKGQRPWSRLPES